MKRRRLRTWLRIGLWGGLTLIVGCTGLYLYAVRPAKLRAAVAQALQTIRFTDARIGSISFSPWNGLEIVDLELVLNEQSPLCARLRASRQPPLLRVAYAQVRCDPWKFLSGTVRPTEVILRGAAVTVLHDPQTGATNWDFPPPDNEAEDRVPRTLYPRITLDQADVQVMVLEDGRPRLLRRWIVDAAGAPEESAPEPAYVFRVRRAAGAEFDRGARPPQAAPLASVHLGGRWIAAQLDWLDLDVFAQMFRQTAALPPEWAEICERANLAGRARLKRLSLRENRFEAAELELADLSFSVPVEDDAARVAPAERFLQIAGAGGEAKLSAAGLTFSIAGRVNGAPANLTFHARRPMDEPPPAGTPAAALAERLSRPAASVAGSEPLRLEELKNIGQWPQEMEFHVARLAFPREAEHGAFVKSSRLAGPVRSFFHDYQPRGPFDLRLKLRRMLSAAGGAAPAMTTEVEGVMDVFGVSCRYYRFPYDIEDVHGQLRFSKAGVFLDGLEGRHGAGRIRADGRLNHGQWWTALDLTVCGQAIALDADLYAALPDEYTELWQTAAPVGVCDVRTRFLREEGSEEVGALPVDIQVDAQLLAGSVATGEGRRLHQADGRISIHNGVLTIHDLHGYWPAVDLDPPAQPNAALPAVRLHGVMNTRPATSNTARTGGTAHATADLHIEGREIPLRQTAQVAADSQTATEICFAGWGDVWGRARSASGWAGDACYVVCIKNGSLTNFDPLQPWTQAQGWIIAHPDQRQVRAFSVRQGETWLEAAGALPLPFTGQEPIQLEIRGGTAALDCLLRQLVPDRWERLAETLGLSGTGQVDVTLQPDPAAATRQLLAARVTAQRMKPTFLPLDLENAGGEVTLNADGFELRNLQARYGKEGEIKLSGRGAWQAGQSWVDLRVTADKVDFCENLVAAMPGKFGELLRTLNPKGRVQANLNRVRMRETGERLWEIDGQVIFENAELKLAFPLTAFDGTLRGACTVLPDGDVDLAADFIVPRGKLDGRPVEGWEGKLLRASGDPWLRLEQLRGRICGGTAWGEVRLRPDSSLYEMSLTFNDLSLEQFLSDGEHRGETKRQGRLDGNLSLRGKTGAAASRLGSGELRIRGASLLRTPVLASVAQEANRKKPQAISDALDLAELRFLWEGSELKLTSVDIQSRDLRLIGTGRWDMRTDVIDLTLVGANPKDWPRIAVLTELVEAAGQEMMQYRVTGPATAPRVTVEPLHNLTEPLRQLLKQR